MILVQGKFVKSKFDKRTNFVNNFCVTFPNTQVIKLNRYGEKFVVRTGVSCQKHPHTESGAAPQHRTYTLHKTALDNWCCSVQHCNTVTPIVIQCYTTTPNLYSTKKLHLTIGVKVFRHCNINCNTVLHNNTKPILYKTVCT